MGLVTGQGSDPQAMMRFSDDGGETWSNQQTRSFGKIGERSKRVKWNRLGVSRGRVYEVAISDPVKVSMVDAYLEVSQGNGY